MKAIRQVGVETNSISAKQTKLSNIIGDVDKLIIIISSKIPKIDGLVSLIDRYNIVAKEKKQLMVVLKDLVKTKQRIQNILTEVNQAEQLLETETGGICPICGGELKL